ncbi:MAG: DsbA family oxidoreductase [Acidobacteria bacterium]|nr:DsbA family oxidoreductase [Acidobacteriota bacterium]
MEAATTMSVEIFSDVVCPWCYIGKRRFDAALSRYREAQPAVNVEVAYRAYQLDPTAPVGESEPVLSAYEKKFGGPEQAAAIIERVSTEAAGEGLEFRMDIAQRSNTLLAHRLLVLAERQGCQHELKERIMGGYFCEGLEIGKLDVLIELGTEVGMAADTSASWLEGTSGNDEVVAALNFALEAGISGVPTYVFDRSSAFSGAQPTDVMLQGLEFNASRITNPN